MLPDRPLRPRYPISTPRAVATSRIDKKCSIQGPAICCKVVAVAQSRVRRDGISTARAVIGRRNCYNGSLRNVRRTAPGMRPYFVIGIDIIFMRETWLHPNRRAILFGCVPPLVIAAGGVWLLWGPISEGARMWHAVGAVALVIGGVVTALLLYQMWRPRIAFQKGHVLFYLRRGRPIAVPVDVVESFFVGQSPAHLPGPMKGSQSVNLIARLAQRRTEWAQQPVKPALGQWTDGHVTIRGTWCEPLDTELIRRINRRLKEVQNAS